MSFIIVYIVSLFVIGVLAKKGMMSPYAAGGFAICISSHYSLGFNMLAFVLLSLYLVCVLGNGIPESKGFSLDQSMLVNNGGSQLEVRGEITFFFKAGMLLLFTFLPLPPAPAHITGLPAIIVISILVIMGSNTRSQWNNPFGYIVAILLQGLLIGLGTWIVDYLTMDLGGMMAIICATSIPGFLFPAHRVEEDLEDLDDMSSVPKIVAIVMGVIFTFYTPGLSSSAVACSFTPPDRTRLVTISALEGAIEGYVVHQFLNSHLTHKSPLGDLFGNEFLKWGSFTINVTTFYWLIAAVIISIVAAIFSPYLEFKPSKYFAVGALLFQGIVFCGPSVWIFIVIGFLCLGLRRVLCYNGDDTLAVAFIIPTLF